MDFLIPVSEEFLETIPGEKEGAEPISFEEFNRIIDASEIEPFISAGGSCANAIKALSNLGIKTALVSSIGTDALGEQFTHSITEQGIIPLFKHSLFPTMRVLCLVTPNGKRTMRFFAGSSQDFSESALNPLYFNGVKIVHLEAYSIRNEELLTSMVQFAKNEGAIISLDLSSFEIVRQHSRVLLKLIEEFVDILFCNIDEIQELTKLSPHDGCYEMQKKCPITVVLMGKEGCLVGHKGEVFASPSFPVQVIDTTGAGDFFAGGFLYGYFKGYSLTECARLGNYLGGSVTEVMGTTFSNKKWQSIRAFVNGESL
ncbi:MAG: adenosine kinase [Parachlamydiaceae bacterium]|nr:adenosine kinase [Parachlamydiaceae bacterium]